MSCLVDPYYTHTLCLGLLPLRRSSADTLFSGPDVSGDKDILHFSQLNFIGGKYDWAYKSVPQKAYDGREIDIPSGRALGGGSVINGCKSVVQKSLRLELTDI